jgi:hypothetical protein
MSKLDTSEIKAQIEKMNKEQQIEVLKKLSEMSNVNLNENSNGTFVNLTDLTEEQLETIDSYISYVGEQESNLGAVENEKTRIQQSYFNGNKEMSNIIL